MNEQKRQEDTSSVFGRESAELNRNLKRKRREHERDGTIKCRGNVTLSENDRTVWFGKLSRQSWLFLSHISCVVIENGLRNGLLLKRKEIATYFFRSIFGGRSRWLRRRCAQLLSNIRCQWWKIRSRVQLSLTHQSRHFRHKWNLMNENGSRFLFSKACWIFFLAFERGNLQR